MSLPSPLEPDAVARLAGQLNGADRDAAASNGRRRLGWGTVRHFAPARLERAARRLAGRAAAPVIERAAAPGREAAAHAAELVAQLDRSLDSLRDDATEWELERVDVRAGMVNVELLKGEVRAVGDELERLGRAIAPAFGMPGAASALADLRERVTSCERRLRHVETSMVSPGPATAGGGATTYDGASVAPETPAAISSLFDYAGFERRFRGEPDAVLALLAERYGDLLASHPPVLDIGCGRAELVGALQARGVEATGIDTDLSMVADARQRGLDVVHADVVAYLRSQPPARFGAIIATHVVEHLQLDALVEMLELCQTRLRAGGVFVAETPNPASLIVLGNSYILDPTHVRPLHPKLLEFLCEAAGFRSLEVRFFAPATGFQLAGVTSPDAPELAEQVNAAFAQLNHVLFGPQDFAIVAIAGGSRAGKDGAGDREEGASR